MKTIAQLCMLTVTLISLHASAQDKLAAFLRKNGMSNIPYTEQGKAQPGGYVSYDTESPKDLPNWFAPVDEDSTIDPLLDKKRDGISIPKDTAKTMKDGSFELSLFGFHPFGQIQTTGTLEYDQIDLKVNALKDNNSYYKHLLLPGTPLEKEILDYGENGNPRLWGNQHVYLILSTFATEAIRIRSTGGKIVGFSSGQKLAKCPDIAGTAPAPDASGGATETAASTQAGGAFRYCQRDENTVELHTATGKPIQVGAQLLRVIPDGAARWNLKQHLVMFNGDKTVE